MFRRERHRRGRGAGADLVIVANRLPVEYDPDAGWRRAPGGLVSAMESVLRDRESTWVGWSGQFSDAEGGRPQLPDRTGSIELVEVTLTGEEVAAHYDGFANGALWPNYHGGIVSPVYHRSQFMTHHSVSQRFARAVAERAGEGARVWVHDYQLQLVPAMLRTLRPDLRIGFFLHIPFPSLEQFSQIPWREQLVEGLLGADVIGFQTRHDAGNFARAATRYAGLPEPAPGGAVVVDGRRILVRGFPIGIRAQDYQGLATTPEIQRRAKQIRADVGDPDVLLLGVDRLDYTKGIDVRIQAVTELLLDGDLDPQRTAFIQVAPPTRAKVEEYQKIRDEVELLVSRANGALGPVGTNPVHYMHQPMPAEELAALYLAADVMLVTPLRDGMNLVAKEYVAARITESGALVLSEFTGAAEQMVQAWLVNPYDIVGMKRTILAALAEPATEARVRMRALRTGVLTDDVTAWADEFLAALAADTTASPGLPDELVAALEALDPNRPLLLALDFDGTLSQLVPVPSDARPVPGVLELLVRISALPNTQVALISGRAVADLASVSGAGEVALLVGSHGQEIGTPRPLDAAEAATLAQVREEVVAAVGDIPGVRVEDKPAGLAVHVRQCAPDDAATAEQRVRDLLAGRTDLHVIAGKRVQELSVRPLDKGSALRTLIATDPRRQILFAGDDVTDEAAMAVLRPDDLSVKVGPGPSVAKFRVADPDSMVELLATVVRVRSN